jgi:hypothetical protein
MKREKRVLSDYPAGDRPALPTGTAPAEAETEIEVTPAMADAGLNTLYGFHITEPDDDEMREAVSAVFKAMIEAWEGPKSPVSCPRCAGDAPHWLAAKMAELTLVFSRANYRTYPL